VVPQNGQRPRSKILVWETPQKEKFPRVKFGFEPLNPKRPPKWAKAPGVKFEFGSLPKRTNFPRVKFEFGPIKLWLVGGPQKWAKSPEKIDFVSRQQYVVKDRDHFKSQCSYGNLFVSSFFVCFLVPFTDLFGHRRFYRVLRWTRNEAFPDTFQKL
jgi:hypothetical protein